MDFGRMIDDIEKNAEKQISADDGDYLDDEGLLMCGRCHTRKQARVEVFGRVRTPFCLCQCAKEAKDAEEAERKRIEAKQQIDRLRSVGFPDAEMSKWTFDKDDHTNEQISKIAHNYVSNFAQMKAKGKGLLFYGNVGTGKTFMSACIANELISQGHPCLVTNFARLVNTLQGMWEGKQEYIDSLDNYSLLVIDDLASERDTEYMGEIVQNIIDARYRNGKPLIVTTNLTAEELNHPAEVRKQRIYSRLLEMCIPIQVTGKDRRKEKLKVDYEELHGLLGL